MASSVGLSDINRNIPHHVKVSPRGQDVQIKAAKHQTYIYGRLLKHSQTVIKNKTNKKHPREEFLKGKCAMNVNNRFLNLCQPMMICSSQKCVCFYSEESVLNNLNPGSARRDYRTLVTWVRGHDEGS